MRIRSSLLVGIVLGAGLALPASAQVPAVSPLVFTPVALALGEAAAISPVDLRGVVVDERGRPLSGAMISALGATSTFAVSDREGRFTFRGLQSGAYVVRAHLQGYVQEGSRVVRVAASAANTHTIRLTRRGTTGPAVLAASVGGSTGREPAEAEARDEAEDEHQHGEVAWRLRHQRRSVLKDAGSLVRVFEDDQSAFEDSLATLGRAMGSPARLATALFADLSVSGQVNLLTTTSLASPEDLFSANAPRGVAYVAIETPAVDGDWTMRGTVTQGDLASWLLAGSYVRRQPATHAYEAGVSYGMQRYLGGNGEALAAIRDASRSVGAVYAYDDWTVAPRLSIGYGARYARYDYLDDPGLLSPQASVTVRPSPDDNLAITATVAHREVAPGAEEFLPPSAGVWLPPERTFSHASRGSFLPERQDLVQVAVEREWPGKLMVGVRAFRERVEDQMVTVFGAGPQDVADGIGHYQVGSAGDFDGHGWGVSVNHRAGEYVHATVDYTQAQTVWRRRAADLESLTRLAASALRGDERIHDLTTSLRAFVPSSDTRVLVVYKLNSALSSGDVVAAGGRTGARYDLQVNQALPFLNFTSAHWEMLVAMSNLFRDELFEGSIYDELLVVRPPTRVLGGVTVRF